MSRCGRQLLSNPVGMEMIVSNLVGIRFFEHRFGLTAADKLPLVYSVIYKVDISGGYLSLTHQGRNSHANF